MSDNQLKTYTLIGKDGSPYMSSGKGTLGGYARGKTRIYGRLDCASAVQWILRGHYVPFRVFFEDEATAIAAGFRPCGKCMPQQYRAWKSASAAEGRSGPTRPGLPNGS